jgi:alanine dehydrogenase
MATEKNIPKINVSFKPNPLEETLLREHKKSRIAIGIPFEKPKTDNRIALTPSAVQVIVSNGHEVLIERNAGLASSFTDNEYSEAGAQICVSKEDVYKSSHIILKTSPINDDEFDYLQPKQIIFSTINTPLYKKEHLEKCLKKNIIGLELGSIKDEAGYYPIVRSMSQIAGIHSLQIAAKYLSKNNGGNGTLLGGIAGVPSATVAIIGAGMVGEYAAKTAIGLGAFVYIFDNDIYRLMRLEKSVNQRLVTSVIEPQALSVILPHVDVLIGATKPKNGVVPMIITEEMVQSMKHGSIIVDINIDNGGMCETSKITTHENPVFILHDVIHYCVPNIPSALSRTASMAISNILMPMLISCFKKRGADEILYAKPNLIDATFCYLGKVTRQSLARKFDLKYTDLNLLLTTNQV